MAPIVTKQFRDVYTCLDDCHQLSINVARRLHSLDMFKTMDALFHHTYGIMSKMNSVLTMTKNTDNTAGSVTDSADGNALISNTDNTNAVDVDINWNSMDGTTNEPSTNKPLPIANKRRKQPAEESISPAVKRRKTHNNTDESATDEEEIADGSCANTHTNGTTNNSSTCDFDIDNVDMERWLDSFNLDQFDTVPCNELPYIPFKKGETFWYGNEQYGRSSNGRLTYFNAKLVSKTEFKLLVKHIGKDQFLGKSTLHLNRTNYVFHRKEP